MVKELETEVNTSRINGETWKHEVNRKSEQLDTARVELIGRDTQIATIKKENEVMHAE